jgi:hypothetical protein
MAVESVRNPARSEANQNLTKVLYSVSHPPLLYRLLAIESGMDWGV